MCILTLCSQRKLFKRRDAFCNLLSHSYVKDYLNISHFYIHVGGTNLQETKWLLTAWKGNYKMIGFLTDKIIGNWQIPEHWIKWQKKGPDPVAVEISNFETLQSAKTQSLIVQVPFAVILRMSFRPELQGKYLYYITILHIFMLITLLALTSAEN